MLLEALIILLIWAAIVALIIHVAISLVEYLGVGIPPLVYRIVWVVFALIVLLYLLRIVTRTDGVILPAASWVV